jgi:hypothetical protein
MGETPISIREPSHRAKRESGIRAMRRRKREYFIREKKNSSSSYKRFSKMQKSPPQ